MKKILTLVVMATFFLNGHQVVNAASVSAAVNDTTTTQQARKAANGLGGLLGSFLGGSNPRTPAKQETVKQDTVPQQQAKGADTKEVVGGILGSLLGGGVQSGDSVQGKSKVGDVIGSIFNGIAGNKWSEDMLIGTWNYTGSKCVLESEDAVKKIGSEIMVRGIEKKMNTYLAKVGFRPGSFSYTFNEDGTFMANMNGRPMRGKYTLDLENKTITMNFFSVVKTSLSLTVVNQKLGMLHDADKLLALIRAIASRSNSASVKSLNTILGGYNGLQIGMEFEKAK